MSLPSLFSITFTPALRPMEAPIYWVLGAVSPAVKQQGQKLRIIELHLHSQFVFMV
jgi:hypothetical protein